MTFEREFSFGAIGLNYSKGNFLNYAPDVSTSQSYSINLHFGLVKLGPFVPIPFV